MKIRKVLWNSFAAFTAFAMTSPAPAQPDPCDDNDDYLPIVGPTESCDGESFVTFENGAYRWVSDPDPAVFVSSCWHAFVHSYAEEETLNSVRLADGVPAGFRHGMNLLSSPGIGDFATPASTLGQHSTCLLPPGAGGASTAWQELRRPTIHRQVDLVTGLPLVQVTDLELPFGGATFRLQRTRSGTRQDNIGSAGGSALNGAAADNFWDWTGMGWMASENPLLVIDSAISDIVGSAPRTTYLVLDAHHTVPFQQIETTGEYEAPPRFRARLSHNGSGWDDGAWTTPPTEYKVFLFEGQLCYTFVVVREDVPPNRYCDGYVQSGGTDASGCSNPQNLTDSSYHDRPILPGQNGFAADHSPWGNWMNPGFGIPYYGLCTRVEDKHGHVAEINYCSSPSSDLDDSGSANCIECMQRCLRKGQIKYIRLKTIDGANETIHWTLLYAHRRFDDSGTLLSQDGNGFLDWIGTDYPDSEANSAIYELMGTLAIDRIYVFAGDVQGLSDEDLADENACLEISHHEQHSMDDSGDEPLDGFNSGLADNWTYMVRYYYEHEGLGIPGTGNALSPSLLIKTKVSTRVDQGGQEVVMDRHRVYHYDFDFGSLWPPATNNSGTNYADWREDHWDIPWLAAVFEEDDLQALMQERQALGYSEDFTIDHLARWRSDTTGNVLGQTDADKLLPFARLRMEPLWQGWDWPTVGGVEAPAAGDLVTSGTHGQYLLNDKARLRNNNGEQIVNLVGLRDEQGRERTYRVNRLLVLPQSYGNPSAFHLEQSINLYDPFRSAFFNPYPFQAYTEINADPDYDEPPDLTQARWIAIIDEFDSWDDADSGSYGSGLAVKDGQLSRRVVEMNPTGYILRDRTWTYSPDGVLQEGGGLGEQFIYKTTEDYFADESDPLPGDDEWDTVRGELVLAEYRSVGWSAADAASSGETQGLTKFFDYRWYTDAEINGADVPYSARVQQVAEGIKRGTADPEIITAAGPKIYTRQVFRDPERPTDILCEVEFTEPVTASGLLTSPPALSGAPPTGMSVQQILTDWVTDDAPDTEERISARMVVGAPRQQYPGSSWYYPVEREFYDEEGNSYWSATGLLPHPSDPSQDASDPLASLIFTYLLRDGEGRSTQTVLDASASQAYVGHDGTNFTTPTWPETGWSRIPDDDGLAVITTFKYDKDLGLKDVYYPNDRRWARRIVKITGDLEHPEPYAREYVFNDLYDTGSGFDALTPGEVNDYGGEEAIGEPRKRRRVEFPDTITSLSFGAASQPDWNEYWRVEFGLDSSGRVAQADLIEQTPFGEFAVGSKFVNDLGAVYREQEIDGTTTRLTRNPLGHVLRRYRGTDDGGWDELAEGDDPENWPDFDMALLERYDYGSGTNDAWLPIATRRYESQVSWWQDFYDNPPSTDSDGIAAVASYDWRMRPVRTDSYEKGDPFTGSPDRLETKLVFLDHADRPRLEVAFGAGALGTLPGDLDPVALKDSDPVPPAEDFYDLALRPTSIVETIYGADGAVTERREYDPAWDGSGTDAPYHASYSYSSKGGTEVYAQSPSQPLRVTRLDALGRATSTAALLPGSSTGLNGYELERTDYTYDGDGNILQAERWVRVESADDVLDLDNAVRTRTISWYDAQKRLVATADLGTEQGEDGFVAGAKSSFSADQFDPPTWTAGTIDLPDGLPSDAIVWIYVYDRYGNRTHAIDPEGVVTEYEYSSTGRLERKTENATASNAEEQRVTDYTYQYGRIKTLTAHRTVGTGAEEQASIVDYGAEIVDEDFEVVSHHNGLVTMLEMMGSSGPTPSDPDIELRYNFAGQIAERMDKRGCVFRYRYDDLGRVDSIEVGSYDGSSWAAGYPASMDGPNGQNPADRIGFVRYVYDDRGDLTEVLTYDEDPGTGGLVITHNEYDHDERGRVINDWQAQGGSVTSSTPKTQYTWDYEPTDLAVDQTGRDRLASMVYPSHDLSTPRTITLGYSSSNAADDMLSRVVGVDSNFGTTDIADFGYIGVGRREWTELAGGQVTQTYRVNTDVGLAGLDLFGRARDLHFLNANFVDDPETMFRAQYYYDKNGNRTGSEVTQVDPSTGNPLDNVRSQVNGFDALSRLISTDYGELVLGSGGPEINTSAQIRADEWGLDLLGNWSGTAEAGGSGVGRTSDGNLDGYGTPYQLPGADAADDERLLTHDVNDYNEITGITLLQDGSPLNSGQDPPRYDDAGNLIFDGEYCYQYDAWDRLVQVNEATIDGQGDIELGDLVKTFMYDGLGRLVRVQTPSPPGSTALRTERLYYDGLRRIQELVLNPTTTLGGAQGNSELEQIAEETVAWETNPDQATAPTGYEEEQQLLSGGGAVVGTVRREYVWGPGDNGFDELLVQYDQTDAEAWPIQDAGGDLVAMCDLDGEDSQSNPVARVVGQWLYDAYGEVLIAEFIFTFAEPHLGHKGMFLDRFDGVATSPRLVPFAHSVYQMRNRSYAPQLGRFLQRDPNQTAMALVEATAMHGRGLGALSLAFDFEGHFGDGANLYEYLGSNPWTRSDPLGLSWDPFDMVDEYLAESTGARAAFLNQLGQDMKAIAIVGATIASYLPVPIVGSLGDMALYALGEQTGEELAVGLAIGMIPGGKLLGGLGKFLGDIGGSAWSAAKHYASKYGRGVLRSAGEKALSLADRATDFLRRKPSAACGCFTAATLVWTPAGAVPIEEIAEGAIVLAAPDDSVAPVLDVGEVSRQIVIGEASLLRLTVRRTDGSTETINTTDEHPFHVAESGEWIRADLLQPGQALSAVKGQVTVESLAFTADRVPVYNLSVPGSPTYFVGESGLWVHNCEISSWARQHWHDQKQILYHWDKWGKKMGLTPDEYTESGLTFMRNNWSKAAPHPLNRPNRMGLKYKDRTTGEFVIFTEDGKLVTYGVD